MLASPHRESQAQCSHEGPEVLENTVRLTEVQEMTLNKNLK